MEPINIVISMDCEPVRPADRQGPATSGPNSYEDSARFIEGYAAIAREFGLPVSFFIHPETAAAHPRLFLDLESDGACLGLHLHPYKFDPETYPTHFGSLSAMRQTALVSEGTAIWQRALGRRPEYFRPGTFSANDATFAVLEELGFRGGSISCPGRNFPDLYASWIGAPPDPHRANPDFRLLPGQLDFVNLPLTVDTSRTEIRNARSFNWDLRPDYLDADYPTIAGNIVAQIVDRAPAVPMIMIVTHNDNDFTDRRDRVADNLQRSIAAIFEACDARSVPAAGATVSAVCDKVRSSVPAAPPAFTLGHAAIQTG
ncbi:MAG: hypothetical protein RLO50_03900 [Azospirillaceae bacterium]